MKLRSQGRGPCLVSPTPNRTSNPLFGSHCLRRADNQEFEKVFNMIDIKTKEFFFKAFGHKKVTAEKKKGN